MKTKKAIDKDLAFHSRRMRYFVLVYSEENMGTELFFMTSSKRNAIAYYNNARQIYKEVTLVEADKVLRMTDEAKQWR